MKEESSLQELQKTSHQFERRIREKERQIEAVQDQLQKKERQVLRRVGLESRMSVLTVSICLARVSCRVFRLGWERRMIHRREKATPPGLPGGLVSLPKFAV